MAGLMIVICFFGILAGGGFLMLDGPSWVMNIINNKSNSIKFKQIIPIINEKTDSGEFVWERSFLDSSKIFLSYRSCYDNNNCVEITISKCNSSKCKFIFYSRKDSEEVSFTTNDSDWNELYNKINNLVPDKKQTVIQRMMSK